MDNPHPLQLWRVEASSSPVSVALRRGTGDTLETRVLRTDTRTTEKRANYAPKI